MKIRWLCLLGCLLLLMWNSEVLAEKCDHVHMIVKDEQTTYEDVEAGHQWVTTKAGICDDCGANLIRRIEGGLTGHVFYMSESIHFTEEGVHLWVFICPECLHIALREEACTGGDWCNRYSAQAGERAPVTYGISLAEERQMTDEDYVKHWVAQNRAE